MMKDPLYFDEVNFNSFISLQVHAKNLKFVLSFNLNQVINDLGYMKNYAVNY